MAVHEPFVAWQDDMQSFGRQSLRPMIALLWIHSRRQQKLHLPEHKRIASWW